MGQEGDEIDFRVRAANTSNNGYPTLRTTNDALDTDLIHLVATHDAAGNQVIYADGDVQKTWNAGVINAFDTSYGLYIGNESSNDRAWLGEICLAAIYDKALTATEVDQNFAAGCAQTTGGGGESPPTGVIYTYDDAGNRLTAGTETFTFDNRNRLLTDSDGAYAWDPAETYTFDAAARLTGVTDGTANTTYGYDSLDRISTRSSADFTYAGAELDPTSDGNDAFHRDPAGRLLAYDTGTAVTHAATDGHNDLYGLINPDGTLTDTATYDPYGEPIATTGTTNPVLGYQTDYTDPTTDHVWMGARWYQPSSATFLSRDTYAGEITTPFTLNRYTYAAGNPIRYWDPTGRCSEYVQETGECIFYGNDWRFNQDTDGIEQAGQAPTGGGAVLTVYGDELERVENRTAIQRGGNGWQPTPSPAAISLHFFPGDSVVVASATPVSGPGYAAQPVKPGQDPIDYISSEMKNNKPSWLWGYGDWQFLRNVRPDAKWDHKPALEAAFGGERSTLTIDGEEWDIPIDLWSNLHYGYLVATMPWRLDRPALDCPAYNGICGVPELLEKVGIPNPIDGKFGQDNPLDAYYMDAGAVFARYYPERDFSRAAFEDFLARQLPVWETVTRDTSRPCRTGLPNANPLSCPETR